MPRRAWPCLRGQRRPTSLESWELRLRRSSWPGATAMPPWFPRCRIDGMGCGHRDIARLAERSCLWALCSSRPGVSRGGSQARTFVPLRLEHRCRDSCAGRSCACGWCCKTGIGVCPLLGRAPQCPLLCRRSECMIRRVCFESSDLLSPLSRSGGSRPAALTLEA